MSEETFSHIQSCGLKKLQSFGSGSLDNMNL